VRLAVRKIARGEPASLPIRYQLGLAAILFGASVDEVRAMPADDVSDVVSLFPIVGGRRGQ
jgi:hypothetical protein